MSNLGVLGGCLGDVFESFRSVRGCFGVILGMCLNNLEVSGGVGGCFWVIKGCLADFLWVFCGCVEAL